MQLIATFVGGFAIAFVKGWLLTLVMLCLFPLLVLSGAAMAIMQGRMASRGQAAYAKAAHIVQQTIASIRTVRSSTILDSLLLCFFYVLCYYTFEIYQWTLISIF